MLTQLLPTIYAIRVPADANYVKYGHRIEYISQTQGIDVLRLGFAFDIIGTVTLNEVDFDCSGIVEMVTIRTEVPQKGGGIFKMESIQKIHCRKSVWKCIQ